MKILKEYEDFYVAVCEWNHKKNWTTFKNLFKVCGEDWAWGIQKFWFILKNTVSGKYKKIEKEFEI